MNDIERGDSAMEAITRLCDLHDDGCIANYDFIRKVKGVTSLHNNPIGDGRR